MNKLITGTDDKILRMLSQLSKYISVFDETGTDRKVSFRAFDRYRSHQKRTHIEKIRANRIIFQTNALPNVVDRHLFSLYQDSRAIG